MELLSELFAAELSAVSVGKLLLSIGLSFVIALYILLVYRITYRGVLYSKRFALSILLLSVVTSVVILAISSNVVLSLGMVGALSIVRFRTAVKDVMDTVFMFWAIVNGIICGAGFVLIAVLASLFTGVLVLAVFFFGKVGADNTYLVVLRAQPETDVKALLPLKKGGKIKSCSVKDGIAETVAEVQLNQKQVETLRALGSREDIESVDLVAYDTKAGI